MLVPVILCGGAGSRLWPVSRETHPKPFMRLADGKSLLQRTFERAINLPDVGEVITVTNRELFFKTEDEYSSIIPDGLQTTYLLEPFARNTAAAVAAACLQAERTSGPNTVLLVLPADHIVSDQAAFRVAVATAQQLALDGCIATFGIRPDRPETGFGYIEHDGQEVRRFVEKPDAQTAQTYLDSGSFLWNSGMFCFRAGVMIAEMQALCPDMLETIRACLAAAQVRAGENQVQVELDPKGFAGVPDKSLDYAVMERTGIAAVVACDLGWTDVGSWNAISELCAPDDQGNRVSGHAVFHDSQNCYVQSGERMVGTVGVQDLVVIDTPDALLVANRSRAQEVTHIFGLLKVQGHDTHRLHRTVHRPWGTYCVLEEGSQFKIKRIEVKPGAALSLQMHNHRSEHWIVVGGTATVVNGKDEMVLESNQSTFIPAGNKHRLSNRTELPLVMIEVQSGGYLGEDDIVRFDDKYGRA
jgi:mannose-1-phosphate guanylyltransferase / mannose-6-phosphate isomerase